jgi:hypothetical protein
VATAIAGAISGGWKTADTGQVVGRIAVANTIAATNVDWNLATGAGASVVVAGITLGDLSDDLLEEVGNKGGGVARDRGAHVKTPHRKAGGEKLALKGVLLPRARISGGGKVQKGLSGVEARVVSVLGLDVRVAVLVDGVAHLAPVDVSRVIGSISGHKGVHGGPGGNEGIGHGVNFELPGSAPKGGCNSGAPGARVLTNVVGQRATCLAANTGGGKHVGRVKWRV